jgi:NAD(P)-dependent dehydrogenase (short-subunit alcohol dehydrogenase family)
MTFSGKTIAITGAAGGIGQALCRHFGAKGARIAAIDRRDTVVEFARALTQEGVATQAAVADIGDAHAVKAVFADLTGRLGAIDILINNAGVSNHTTFASTDPQGWRDDINSNLNGAYSCAHAVLAGMKGRRSGVIINIGSVNGVAALGDPAYSAAKAGMIAMTRSLAQEYGRFGIRVNIVLPGTVRTPIWDERAKKDPAVLRTLERWYPLGRIVEPHDIVNAVAFLASDLAAAITGVALPVDCGLTSGNIVMARELTVEDF